MRRRQRALLDQQLLVKLFSRAKPDLDDFNIPVGIGFRPERKVH